MTMKLLFWRGYCEKDGSLFTKAGEPVEIEPGILRRPLYAADFTRYHFSPKTQEQIVFPYTVSEKRCTIIEESLFRDEYPKAYAYLSTHKKQLSSRKHCRVWYGFSAPRSLHIHERAEIIVPVLANRGLYARVPNVQSEYCMMASAGFSVRLKEFTLPVNPSYILGLINSKLLYWNLRLISNKFRGGWVTCTKQYFGQLPIHAVNFSDSEEKLCHDKIVECVDNLITLHSQAEDAKMPQIQTMLTRQIEVIDQHIDTLVYKLYGVTDEEILMVEAPE